jgi:hypothetical protein
VGTMRYFCQLLHNGNQVNAALCKFMIMTL